MNLQLLLVPLFLITSVLAAAESENEAVTKNTQETLAAPATPAPVERPLLVDTILAIIYTDEGADVVTHSDVMRPTIDGRQRTLDDVLFDRLVYRDSQRLKVDITDDMIDSYIANVKNQYHLTEDQIRQMFKQAGYTYQEGREQFRQMYANAQMIDLRVRSRALVSEKEIMAYYQDNPVYEQARYVLERAFISFEQKKEMGKVSLKNLEWFSLPEVTQDQLADAMKFVTEFEVGDVAPPRELADGYEFFRLKQKTPQRKLTYEERYQDIVEHLRAPKAEKLLEQYRADLFASAQIVYLELTPSSGA